MLYVASVGSSGRAALTYADSQIVAQVCDSVPSVELIGYEDLSFVEQVRGPQTCRSRHQDDRRRLPVNPSGGLCALIHPRTGADAARIGLTSIAEPPGPAVASLEGSARGAG